MIKMNTLKRMIFMGDVNEINFNHREARIIFKDKNYFDVYLSSYKKIKVEG
jgi:hypothetical protein